MTTKVTEAMKPFLGDPTKTPIENDILNPL